jgi:hypothetical protein
MFVFFCFLGAGAWSTRTRDYGQLRRTTLVTAAPT